MDASRRDVGSVGSYPDSTDRFVFFLISIYLLRCLYMVYLELTSNL